jgi:vacuolar-type H+-ATPase subunit E/Vma4
VGYKELIESLRKETDDKVRQLWKEVEAEADEVRSEFRTRAGQIKKRFQKDLALAVQECEEAVFREAGSKVLGIKLSAERALSDRLFSLAVSCLHELRSERYNDVFKTLVNELPAVGPEEVRVNPEDVWIAQEHFPHSRILPDENISGGMEVMIQNGRICINNTFEKRLEKAWEDVLPLIINDVYTELSNDEPS